MSIESSRLIRSTAWRTAMATTSLIVSSAVPGLVHAQEAPGAAAPAEEAAVEGEILVTANRRLERPRDVPVTISVFSGEELANKGIESIADIGAVTPGVQFNTIVGYAVPFIRGVGSTSTGPGFENPIAVYIDGVYIAGQGASLLSLANIEAIEVDKGPQGTLFGRNATGGAIQIRTLTPSFEFKGNASVGYGNYNDVTASGYVTGGLSDSLAADLAVSFRHQGDGYGTNLTTGNDFERADEFVARGKLLFKPTDATEITLAADYAKTIGRPALLPYPGSKPTGNRPPAAYRRDGYGADPRSEVKQWGVALNIRQELGPVDLISITAYRQGDFHSIFANTFTDDPAATFQIDTIEPHRQFSQELQLQSNGTGPFSWTLGAYYFRERASLGEPTFFTGGSMGGLLNAIDVPDSTISSPAVFGQATWEILPGTKLTGGLRYTWERKRLVFQNFITFPGGDPIQTVDSDQAETFRRATWRLALTHELNDEMTVFASYNRGFKSGGFNTAAGNTFAPEQVDAYEGGLKAEIFGRKLRFNVSGFYYDYSNMQVTSYPLGVLQVTNGGKSEIYGVDVDFAAPITPEFTMSGGFEALHVQFTRFENAPQTIPQPGGGNIQVGGLDASGNDLPKAPKVSFNAGATYEKQLDAGTLKANILWSYNDGWFADADNRLTQANYTLLNASLGFELNNGVGIRAWGKNLTDTNYGTVISALTTSDYIQYAPPRTYGVTLSYKF